MTKLPTPVPMPFEYKTVALDSIASSLTNPRKNFDQGKLEELSASIAVNGILSAPTVRPVRAAGHVVPGRWVLISGERRTKAARLVPGLKEIEVKVIDCDDVKAAELQLIENDEREDLSPLERAEGYQQLMKTHGLSADQVAERVRRKRSWVYDMIALLKLAPPVKKALSTGELDRSCATLLTTLPLEAQPGALEVALHEGPDGDALSYRALREWIKAEFMLDLADAPFDTEDAQLVLAAGPCSACPKRTGFAGQADLFAEKGKKTDLCKDKPCFDKKAAESRRLAILKAKDSGADVLPAAETRAALKTGYDAEYVRLDDGHRQALGEGKTWSDALKGTKLEPQIAITPEGKPVKVARKEDVRAALKDKGSKLASSPALFLESDIPTFSKEPSPKFALQAKVADGGILLMTRAIEKNGLPRDLLVLLAQHMVKTVGTNAPIVGRGWDHLSPRGRLDRLVHEPTRRLEGIIFEFAFADLFVDVAGDCPEFKAAAKALGIDLKALEKEVEAEAALKAKAEKQANPKAKPVVDKVPTKVLAAEAKRKAKAVLQAKIDKVKKSKLTPHQQKALVAGMKSSHAAKAKKSKGGAAPSAR